MPPSLSDLSFRYPFRKYQRMILDQMEQAGQDRKFHIVAPPGSGKTIVGLELIRRLGVPAVVFAPTTAIQVQWYQKVGMFLPENSDISLYATMEPERDAPIRIFTYQLISTPAEAQIHLEEAALQAWKEELLTEGRVRSSEEAQARLETLRQNNPQDYRKDLLRYVGRIKHRLLREPDVDISPFLHANALSLIDKLVASGVQTVVLDECHHLLDYWAVVLRYLIGRIANPHVIGLTATLPSPEDDKEFENYDSLLGEVDFEVPTPAVVKEGDLAPYRDLVYLVRPTSREYEYLRRIQEEFEQAIGELRGNSRFQAWLAGLVEIPSNSSQPALIWQQRWNEMPLLMLAAVRLLRREGKMQNWPYPIPAEAQDALTMEDWVRLLERFGLDVLKPSMDPEDHRLLRELRRVIQPFGFTLTERGMRQGRSPGDLVLTFSEAKDQAVARILAAESEVLGERLRAIVVTDFERLSSGVQHLKGVLDQDAGSAVRVFRHLAQDPRTRSLAPMLVTGSRFYCPREIAETLIQMFEKSDWKNGLEYTCKMIPLDWDDVVEIDGEGRDWTPRTYVRLATEVFEKGVSRCLVGTRAIFGEGWDALSLNTLIDLTSATTSTSVQQLRGRTLRLNPDWPRKVSHHWDVICVAPEFEQGKIDLQRLVVRHERFWSLAICSDWLGERPEAPDRKAPSHLHGKVVRGILHVNPGLFIGLLQGYKGWLANLDIEKHNRTMLKQVRYRNYVYDLWEIGLPYSNFAYRTSIFDARDLKIRTAFTLQSTLVRITRNALLSIGSVFFALWYVLNYAVQIHDLLCITLILLATLAGIFVYAIWQLIPAVKKLFTEQMPDAILLDVGRALLHTLRQLRLVSPNLQPDYVRVARNPDDTYQVFLDYASPQDANTFITAFGEIFAPVYDQPYLIMRTEDRLPNLPLRALWLPLRTFIRKQGMYPPAYHPVPKILARRGRVEVFAQYWAQYVGGGQIVFTRSEQGRAILLSARSQRRPKVGQMAFEIWK